MNDTARNATLADFAELLQAQHARKLDVVAPAPTLRADDGHLVVAGAEPTIDADGVTAADGRYRPTAVFDEGVAAKLGIPLAYVRRMREQRSDLYDANVNGWLHGVDGGDPDPRSFLVRLYRGEDGGDGMARALLSDSFNLGLDHLDVLTAALDGVRQAGAEVNIDGCDLTDRRMYVRIVAPQVQALAPQLLDGYRSPWSGASGTDNPTVFAGFVLSNSETGGGAFTITPRLVVQVCNNGMTIARDAIRAVHVGGKLDEGVVRWSADTHRKQAGLITAKARDAVATFLDVEYMQHQIRVLTEAAGKPVEAPEEFVRSVGKQLQFDQATTDAVLGHFIRGGQVTVGGVAHAITAHAQEVDDADRAADLEAAAVSVLAG